MRIARRLDEPASPGGWPEVLDDSGACGSSDGRDCHSTRDPVLGALAARRPDALKRIARLLDEPACPVACPKCWTTLAFAAVALAVIAIQPGTLYSVHWLLEGLMR